MLGDKHISVVIPALNEERAIANVIEGLNNLKNERGQPLIDDIVVCDNGSIDRTGIVATENGARVVSEPEQGYGVACLTAIKHLNDTDIVLFVDGDASCDLNQANSLLHPLYEDESVHMVIGSRALGVCDPGALTPPQKMGNALATFLVRLLWRENITDLGPFRAIRRESLRQLAMADRRFGWTIEMQIKAIQHGFKTVEIPVNSKRRIGVSKISGTLKGVVGAGVGIIGKIVTLKRQELNLKMNSDFGKNPTRFMSIKPRTVFQIRAAADSNVQASTYKESIF